MKLRYGIRSFLLLLLFPLLLLPANVVRAADAIASVKALTGEVDILKGGVPPATRAKLSDPLATGDIVRTKSGASAEVLFIDGSLLKIAQRSRIDIGTATGKNGTVRLARGTVEAVVDPAYVRKATTEGKGKIFEIHTPNAVAGVRGTRFFVTHDRDLTGVLVREGTVYVYNLSTPENVVTVEAGSLVTVSGASPPSPPRKALDTERNRLEKEFSLSEGSSGAIGPSGWVGSGDTAATPAAAVTPGSARMTGMSATPDQALNGMIPAELIFPQAVVLTPPPPPPPLPPLQPPLQPPHPVTTTPVNVDMNFH